MPNTTYEPQGEANHFALIKSGKWIAAVQLNGELHAAAQEASMKILAAALDYGPAEPFTCRGCGREESVCSNDPCLGVLADREA